MDCLITLQHVQCTLLGANFDTFKDFRPFIINPVTNEKVYIILDSPHMIKLIRNCIGTWKTIYYKESKIEWKFFEYLEKLGSKNDVVSHKITKEHINFENNKMNVSLAAQLLSNSSASSMENLQTLPQTSDIFRDCNATVEFTRRMNNLFDIFNSKTDRSTNIFRSPINNNTKDIIFSFLDETVEYINELKEVRKGRSILKSNRQTGFKGFIINATNLKEMYEKFVESGKLTAIPTQYLNQDPLENFFGRSRSCLGSNTNPTVEQFCAAYRKTLVNLELTCSSLSNCADQLNILKITSLRSAQPKTSVAPVIVRVEENKNKRKRTNDHDVQSITDLLNPTYKNPNQEEDPFSFDGSEITINALSKRIEHKITTEIRSHCLNCLEITKNIFNEPDQTVKICSIANKHLRKHAFKIDFCYELLIKSIQEEIENYNLYIQTDFSHDLQHKSDLIRFIIEEFIRIRASCIAKKITLNEKKKLLRRKTPKHYAGQ